jgi:holo-[acyl-carrier protein] synthase
MQHVGVDIIEIKRIEEALQRFGEGFLQRIYTGQEIDCYREKLPSLAARFAGKEAVIKALDAPGISPREIEILSATDGKPLVKLYGKAKEKAEKLGLTDMDISLSHSRDYAVAFVVGQSRG